MEIRLAQKCDIPGIIALLKQVGEVHHRGRPDLFRAGAQKYNEAELEAILQDPSRPIFVSVEESAVLGYGFCMIQETRDNSVLCDDKSIYIDDICIDESCRGKHIGTAIFRHIHAYARSIGCDSITLNVWSFNESAMKFYERMGMKPRKTVMEMLLEEN